jgi:hypothetical protein
LPADGSLAGLFRVGVELAGWTPIHTNRQSIRR